MIFQTPHIGPEEGLVLEWIEDLRGRLRHQTQGLRRWVGLLRRVSFARNIQGSNSIEGYDVSLDDALAVTDLEAPINASEETARAIQGYREAMTYVLQLSGDPTFNYSGNLLKSLHYMMLSYDLDKSPGLWRAGPIFVQREETREIVYEGPPPESVPDLIDEMVGGLNATDTTPALVRAAMAHLNLVMIHPFRDGNGRMARCLQTLVLAREGILAQEFCSIEEYLGHNTEAYYDVLADVGRGRWSPDLDAAHWIRFSLTAHYRQATTLLRRVQESERRWNEVQKIVEAIDLPERSAAALFNVSMGFRIRNPTYRSSADVSGLVASRDLKALVDAGLLRAEGEKRGRFYTRGEPLMEIDRLVRRGRSTRSIEDPFVLAADRLGTPTLWVQQDGASATTTA